MTTPSTVIPGARYHDALAMIDWLCQAFGFARHAVHEEPKGVVMHAELSFGSGMIMIGSVTKQSPYAPYAIQPDETDGRETRSVYLVVDDCDAIYASAKAAGAEMLLDLEEKSYGGKGFTCRDPEGHIWSIGSYDPWAIPPHK